MSHDLVTLATFGDLAAKGYRLTGYCLVCGKTGSVDVTGFDADELYVCRRWKCAECGSGEVEIRLHPPVDYSGGPLRKEDV
jgi:hypothetical protein